ncbi:MAG: rhodanese-like domain-containing protein [Gammaproteobacteria bacterium]|nr:rhodanese-like domain-containing protein [Gammaproteobacteria bacterium]
MLDQLIEFVINHYVLVGLFFALLIAFFLNEGRLGGATVSPSELVTLINKEEGLVLDIRDRKDFNAGHIVDAVNVPYTTVDSRLADLEKYQSRAVVIVCKMGQHSGAVGRKLRALGFNNVRRLSGGIAEWRASNMPLVK